MGNQNRGQCPQIIGVMVKVTMKEGIYVARASGVDIRASCRSGSKAAAAQCADKVLGEGNWNDPVETDLGVYVYSRKVATASASAAAPKPASAWRAPSVEMPDDDVTVMLRCDDNAFPAWPGFHDGDDWHSADGSPLDGPVKGWMHLHEAAVILDAATRGEVDNG